MPDPTDQLNQLDLQGLPPEEAAKLIRAHAAALQAQQRHALLGMLGPMPELQKAGEAEYGQAGRERGTTQELGTQVLKQTLGEKEAAARLKELENQGLYQRGMLSVALGNLKLTGQQNEFDRAYKGFMAQLAAEKPAPIQMLKDIEDTKLHLEAAKKIGLPKVVTDILEGKLKAQSETLKASGYKTEGAPQWPGGGSQPTVTPAAAPAIPTPAPMVVPPTGSLYSIVGPAKGNPGKVTVRRNVDGQMSDMSPEGARKLVGQ